MSRCVFIQLAAWSYCSSLNINRPFDVHCCHIGTAIKHAVPDRVSRHFNFWHPGTLTLKWRLNPVWHIMLDSCTHMATVGVEGLNIALVLQRCHTLRQKFCENSSYFVYGKTMLNSTMAKFISEILCKWHWCEFFSFYQTHDSSTLAYAFMEVGRRSTYTFNCRPIWLNPFF